MVPGRQGFSRTAGVIRRLLVAALILAAMARAASNWWDARISEPHLGSTTDGRLLTVPFGASVRGIGRMLQEADVIRSGLVFAAYVRWSGSDPLQAGEYLFENPASLTQVVQVLREGRVHQYRITVPEGMTLDEIIDRFVQEGLGRRHELEPLAGRIDLLGGLDPEATDLEGYLFPDTYHFTRSDQELTLVSTLVTRFKEVWTPQRQKRADDLDLTIREVITLASLIEKEAALPAERALVAAVFHNRLRRNIKLDCDPTIIYAIRKSGDYDGVLHKSDLSLDSPYNTYLYAGLPPGPIANPGTASIDAALHPAPVRHLYFVSRNDGSHVFSTSYREHQRAVRRYQR
ncbi:MAG: endolytic transglycosylase MltG [Candidatus Aminicenantes bacterium]|nr:endolytic transglycosylase MltG [Candidatus Aminicenantes bacterium]